MMRLHHVPMSRSFRVLWLLEELGLEAELVMHSIRGGTMHTPEGYAVSPAGRVPALELGGETMFESGAIVQTLVERHPDAGLGRAVGDAERPAYLQAMWFSETMASLIEQLNMNHLFLRDPSLASPVVIKLLTARFKATLRGADTMLAGDWVLPSGFSAADIMFGFNLRAVPYYVRFDEFPRLQGYLGRCAARPAYQRALEKDGEQEFYTKDFYPVPEH